MLILSNIKNNCGSSLQTYIVVLFIFQFNLYSFCRGLAQNITYPKVRNFPYNNISYPDVFHSRSSALNNEDRGDGSSLKINGESYNIRTSPISDNKETHISRDDIASPRDSYSPYGQDSNGGGSSDSSNSNSQLLTPEPTDAPIIGAIDYVLLPLIFLGTAGPIFVVIYIVMASIEYKLTPNIQQRSVVEGNKHYIDMTSVFQTVRPVLNILYESASRAIDYGECKEKVACQVGSYAKGYKGYFFYHYFERFLRGVTPRKYAQPLKVYIASVKNDGEEACSKYSCFY